MNNKRGKVQEQVLRCLRQHKRWYRGCGWIWSDCSTTVRVLDSLVRRGDATATQEEGYGNRLVYRPVEVQHAHPSVDT